MISAYASRSAVYCGDSSALPRNDGFCHVVNAELNNLLANDSRRDEIVAAAAIVL